MKKIKFVLFLVGLICAAPVFSQSIKTQKADEEYNNMNYVAAIAQYERILKEDRNNEEVIVKLADCYRKINDSKNAEHLYARVVRLPDPDPSAYLYYAQALSENDKKEEAKTWYEKYHQFVKKDTRGTSFPRSFNTIQRFYEDSADFRVDFVNINSPESDFSPMFYKKGLIFCSARNKGKGVKRVFGWNQSPFLDFYFVDDTAQIKVVSPGDKKNLLKIFQPSTRHTIANDNNVIDYSDNESDRKDKSEKEMVHRLGSSVNTKYHEGPLCFFTGEDSVIFTRNNIINGKYKTSDEGVNKLKLFIGKFHNGELSGVHEMPFNSDDYSTGHPALTPDNKRLYFCSDMPGGYGGTDIYVSVFENGHWSKPKNLGKKINTEGNEMFPYVDAKGNLYFSSDGLPGLGGLDIFRAEMQDNTPVFVRNMGYPMNSDKDDFGMVLTQDCKKGYFSSNRKRGLGDDDIYRILIHPETGITVEGVAKNVETDNPLDSVVIYLERSGQIIDSSFSNEEGMFRFRFKPGSEYKLIASRPGFKGEDKIVSTSGVSAGEVLHVQLLLSKEKIIRNALYSVKGKVTDKLSGAALPGVTVILSAGKDINPQKCITGSDGTFSFAMQKNREYRLSAEKEGYYSAGTNLSTKGKKGTLTTLLALDKLEENKPVVIQGIYYDYKKWNIRKDAKPVLDELVRVMKNNPKIKVEISSHTDSRASEAYNLVLSQKRADEVVNYLVENGISRTRLVAKGYGEQRLINRCNSSTECSEEEHQANRRTEFRIIGKVEKEQNRF